MLPTPLLEQVNLFPGENIQILCLNGGIVLCRESTLERDDLKSLLAQLQIASELVRALPDEVRPLIQQLDTFIQEDQQ